MYERALRVTWSPDGLHVVAGASFGGPPKVAIFDAVSWARHDLAGAARPIFAWAPDSKRLLYVAEREQYTDTLYAVDATGGAPSVVYESMFQINDVAVGANGMIAVTEGAYLGVMASDGSGYRRLAEGVFQSVVMSPAGTKVATVSQDSLLIVDVASGATTKVAPSQSLGFPYGWSKSGDHVAYNQVDGDGHPHAVVARADGSALQTIMDSPLALSFSHDGRQVAASDGRTMGEPKTHDLVVVDLASGARNVVLQQAGSLSWSPAGSLIATAVSGVSGGREGVCLVSGDGANVRRLVDFAEGTAPLGSPRWSPGGDQLLVATL
jgi:Tol biopolymer transport system component